MRNLLEDLKFFIGAFFLLLSGLLLGEGLIHPVYSMGYNLNVIAGTAFFLFACVPIWIAIKEHLRS